jgi:putative transcriptional regulator
MKGRAFVPEGKRMKESETTRARIPTGTGWLTGRMLVAMPSMADPRFARTVIYLCSHGPEGAMGLVLNRIYGDLNFRGLLDQMNITLAPDAPDLPVHFGGPVEPARGFVLHTADYGLEGTMPVSGNFALTATIEILKALAEGRGPQRALLALGYAGWGAGQLDEELQTNGWLVAEGDEKLVFDTASDSKWDKVLAGLGVSPLTLSGDVGHA